MPQLGPQYLLKQRELQLGQPSFRNKILTEFQCSTLSIRSRLCISLKVSQSLGIVSFSNLGFLLLLHFRGVRKESVTFLIFFVTQFLSGAGAVFGAHFVLEDVRRLRDGKALFCDLSHFGDQDYTGMHHKVCSARCGSCKLFWETVSSLVSHLGFEALHRSFTVSQRLGVWTVRCRCKTL